MVIPFLKASFHNLAQRKQLIKKKQIKRFWRRGIFRDRKLHSEYYTLYQTLRESDREFHYRYLRMSEGRFDHLLGLIRDKITKKDTMMREALTAEERLVITCRYLSAGMSQQTLCYNFRVGRALHDAMSPTYLRTPSTEKEWRHVANDFEKLWDLPHCIGAIDGNHIGIDCPKNSAFNYYNYKGFFSMIILAVCGKI